MIINDRMQSEFEIFKRGKCRICGFDGDRTKIDKPCQMRFEDVCGRIECRIAAGVYNYNGELRPISKDETKKIPGREAILKIDFNAIKKRLNI